MNNPVREASMKYSAWKALHKVNLQVYTDEQMFCIGYEFRDQEVNELEEMVALLIKRLNEKETKDEPRKPAAKRATTSTRKSSSRGNSNRTK